MPVLNMVCEFFKRFTNPMMDNRRYEPYLRRATMDTCSIWKWEETKQLFLTIFYDQRYS